MIKDAEKAAGFGDAVKVMSIDNYFMSEDGEPKDIALSKVSLAGAETSSTKHFQHILAIQLIGTNFLITHIFSFVGAETQASYHECLSKAAKKAFADSKLGITMLVVDATHKSISDFDHVYYRAASSRFVPMVLDIVTPQAVCEKRMIAALEAVGCTEGSLNDAKEGFTTLASTWEKTPEWMATLDLSWLAAEASDCNMEDDFGAAEAMARQEVDIHRRHFPLPIYLTLTQPCGYLPSSSPPQASNSSSSKWDEVEEEEVINQHNQ